jgi:hypothetical protein
MAIMIGAAEPSTDRTNRITEQAATGRQLALPFARIGMDASDDGFTIWCNDARAAVEMASRFRAEGRFDIFRGQIRNYPLQPTILRPHVDRHAAVTRLEHFASWVQHTPELASLHDNRDAILAVAQHYGIPTNLVDFTTEPSVAGFFAEDGPLPHVEAEEFEASCIICVNRTSLARSWADLNRGYRTAHSTDLVRILEIDVHNLWRLQAQHGLFIAINASPDLLEAMSPFFRILFPHKAARSKIDRTSIYPAHKSHLELLLDEYFSNERALDGIEKCRELGLYNSTVVVDLGLGDVSAFRGGELPPRLQSWNDNATNLWRMEPDERLSDTRSRSSIRIKLKEQEPPLDLAIRIRRQVIRAIRRKPDLRCRSIQWSIKHANGSALTIDDEDQEPFEDGSLPQIVCSDRVVMLWNGLRRLPVSDEQLASSIANYISLALHGRNAISTLFGKTVGVEFSAGAGRNVGYVSDEDLLRFMRSDLYEFLQPEERQAMTDSDSRLEVAMSLLFDPSRLFEFSGFADLFVRQIIPTQLTIRLDGDMFVFSPGRIERFGNR